MRKLKYYFGRRKYRKIAGWPSGCYILIDWGLLYGWTAQPDSACSPQAQHAACTSHYYTVTSQFTSLLKEMQDNPLEHSPLSKSDIFSMEYSRIDKMLEYFGIL